MRYKELTEHVDRNKIKELLEEYFEILIPGTGKAADYRINADGSVDVDGDVTLRLQKSKVQELPVTFGKITGSFMPNNNPFTSLKGMPRWVGRWFDCASPHLTSLVGAPEYIGEEFHCYGTPFTSLEGFPKYVGGRFYATWAEQMPLLRTLICKKGVYIGRDRFGNAGHPINGILNKYIGQVSGSKEFRHAVLDCQKELIEAGFSGNARW
jgi:hypothetical protein